MQRPGDTESDLMQRVLELVSSAGQGMVVRGLQDNVSLFFAPSKMPALASIEDSMDSSETSYLSE